MGCSCFGENIEVIENNPKGQENGTEEKEKKEENLDNKNYNDDKENLNKDLYNNILATANSIDNNNSVLNQKEIRSLNLSKKEKDETLSRSRMQLDIKSKINQNDTEGELEKDIKKDGIAFSLLSPRGIDNDGKIILDNEESNNNQKFGPIPYNSKDKLNKRNNIKYAILENEKENEDNSNSKKNAKDYLNENIEYKEPKYNHYISRNEILNENNRDLNTIPTKFIRKSVNNQKKFNTEIFGRLLLNEERKLSLSFENLIPLQTGKPSKKYKILAVLGNGSFGKVYKAINIKTRNIVAIKSIKKKKESKNEENNIENEINVLKKLDHPNIVKIYEFYNIKDNYYLITEFCKYGELYKYRKFHFSEKQLCVLFYQIFSGLIYLHDNNIIHRDIKLENIMIDSIEKDNISCEPYFFIKIIDFGSAKYFSKEKSENEIIGSSYYIAPEVLKQDYNEKCDTWSVGVLLYMLLTNKAPFNGKNDEIIIEKIKEGNYDKKSRKLMDYSDDIRDLLDHLLEVDVDKRFSAKQALNHEWFKKYRGRTLFSNFKVSELNDIINNLFNYKNINKIQELVLSFLVHNSPSTAETLTILKIFRFFNTSGTCKLLKEELIEGLYKYKDKKEVDSIVEDLFRILDLNKKGYIEFEEFLRACIEKKKLFTKENLKYAFQFIDKEKSNGIDGKKIINAFKADDNRILEGVFNNLIIKVDEDGDGIINFNEFQKLCLL